MVQLESTIDSEIREKTREAIKRHKASWIQLGQYLYTIHREKLFKSWGFQTFEGYCRKELRIKLATAGKLLKSYSFLEKEEPEVARLPQTTSEESESTIVPDYESVNLLRLAKENKALSPHDIAEVRESVIEKAKEPKEVRAQVKQILEDKDPKSPEEQLKQRQITSIKRAVSFLSSTKTQFEKEKTVPKYLIDQMADLVGKLEDQLD